jgi:folate-binding protein YgfZ
MSVQLALPAALNAMRDSVVAVELDALATLRLDGGDAREALNRLVSQDVRSLGEGELRLALLLAAKGQFRALMAVGVVAGEVLVAPPPGREGAVRDGLARYLALSRIAVEPVEWSGGAVTVIGPGAMGVAERLVPGAAPGRLALTGAGGERLLACGEAFVGSDAVVLGCASPELRARVLGELAAAGVPLAPRGVLDLERIRRGFPAWGAELTDAVLPPEVGLEERAISYTKGCYVGQETIARMKTYGHPNRALAAVRQTAGPAELPALPLPLAPVGDEKVRGELTSATVHPELGVVGLALLRRELASPGTVVVGAGRTYEVASLPLW